MLHLPTVRSSVALLATALLPSVAVAVDPFPTLCLTGEVTHLSARMGTLVRGSQSSQPFSRNGKILSICANRDTEPVSKIVYRYGREGAVELERVATKQAPFFVHQRSNSPHTGQDILFFTSANFTYYVIRATGQGNGIILLVFAGGKQVRQLFSGVNEGDDFYVGALDLNFGSPVSAVLVPRVPAHKFE